MDSRELERRFDGIENEVKALRIDIADFFAHFKVEEQPTEEEAAQEEKKDPKKKQG